MAWIRTQSIAMLALLVAVGIGIKILVTDQSPRVGYVNARNVIDSHVDAPAMQAQIREKSQAIQANLKSLEGEIDSLFREFDRMKVGKEKDSKALVLRKKSEDLARYRQESFEKIRHLEADLLKPILSSVNATVKEFAERNGVEIILGQVPDNLVYASEALDMTEGVKAELRKQSNGAQP